MNLLIIGAAGRTGRELLALAQQHGDNLTVLVRHPEKLQDISPEIRVAIGDATDEQAVTAASRHQDAILVTIGRGGALTSEELFTKAAAALVRAAQENQIPQIIWLSSFGVGPTLTDAPQTTIKQYANQLGELFANKNEAEQLIRRSNLRWTIVYPTRLTDGPAASQVQVGRHIHVTVPAQISRKSVAALMYQALHDPQLAGEIEISQQN